MIFIHRFGALLNTHLHFHCIVVDGVFEGDAQDGAVLHPASGLDASAIGKAQAAVRRRLLRAALRRGLLSADDAQKCGGEMQIIAFITGGTVIREILGHLGEPTSPPRLMPARGPPLWEMQDGGSNAIDPQAQPAPDYEFDQRIAW